MEGTKEKGDRKRISELGLYIHALFSAGLWGNELLNLSLTGLLAHNDEDVEMNYVMLTLLANFKGETGLNYYLIHIVGVTHTEINNWYSMNELMSIKREEVETKGC